MASERVLITFEVDASGAIRQVDNVKKTIKEIPAVTKKASAGMKGLTSSMAKIGGAAVLAAVAMRALRGAVRFMGESVEAAANQQRIFVQLQTSIERVGASYQTLGPILDMHFARIQRNTRFGDDESAKTMQMLIDTTGDVRAAYKLLMPTMDLAIAKDMELSNAVKLVGMAAAGQLGTLSRYGIILDDKTRKTIADADAMGKAEIVAKLLNDRFSGAAQADMETYGGKVQRVANSWGDFKERMGETFTEMAEGTSVFETLTDSIIKMTEAINWAERGLIKFKSKGDEILAFTLADDIKRIREAMASLTESGKDVMGFWSDFKGMTGKDLTDALRVLEDRLAEVQGNIASGAERIAVLTDRIEGNTVALEDNDEAWTQTGGAVASAGDQVKKASKEIGNAIVATNAFMKAALATKKGFNLFENSTEELGDTIDRSLTMAMNEGRVELIALLKELSKLGQESKSATAEMSEAFREVLTVTILGDWEDFFDLLDNMFKESAESMIDTFSKGFKDAFKEDGNIFSAFSSGWQAIKDQIEADPLGTAMGGIAGAFAASQGTGGAAGGFQGALGGAMAGMGIAAGLAQAGVIASAFGPVGWIIAGVLAIAGGIMGYMGSGGQDIRTGGVLNLAAGTGAIDWQRDQQLSQEIRAAWVNDRLEEWEIAFEGMFSVLQLFNDASLFELLREPGTWNFRDMGGIDEFAMIFREQIIPQYLKQVFKRAINRGLRGFGVSSLQLSALWKELEIQGTERMIESLGTFVSAVVGMADLLEAMDPGAMLDEVAMNTMDGFRRMITDTMEAIEIMTVGIDSMDIISQAETALEVQSLVAQVRQQEIQLLRQIDNLSKQINANVDRAIESIQLGGMEPGQQTQFFLDRITSIMDQLAAGVGSPEEIAALMQQLLFYSGQYQNVMGENLYQAGPDGIIPAEWLTSILEEGRSMANDQLEAFRQEILDANQLVIDELVRIQDILLMTEWERYAIEVGIDINVTTDPAIIAAVNARIDRLHQRMEDGHWVGQP